MPHVTETKQPTIDPEPTLPLPQTDAVPAPHCPLLVADVASMPIEEFAGAGLVLKVFSTLLDDVVLLASDNASVPPQEECVVYRAAELDALRRLDGDGLRQIHRFKRLLGGSIESVEARGG